MTDFEKVTSFENLYKAYRRCMSGNGYAKSKLRFQAAALDGICQIRDQLLSGEYCVSGYNEFMIYDPKERLIQSGSFKDKIVQHSLCDNVLVLLLSKKFLLDNYAGQIGKGTLFGLERLKTQMVEAHSKYGMDCWILKGDIRKFFYRINHEKLKAVVRREVKDDRVYSLCEQFIDSTEGLGLPLGNQISQVFALLYLSGMDHYICETLNIRYYGRYMDDFFLIHHDREYLKKCLHLIEEFVDGLALELNEKTQIIPFKNGIKFCGFHTYITQDGKAIRKLRNENKHRAKKKFRWMARLVRAGKLSEEKFRESYGAWKNHASHGNCIKLIKNMDDMVFGILENI